MAMSEMDRNSKKMVDESINTSKRQTVIKKSLYFACFVLLIGGIIFSWYTLCSAERFFFYNTDDFIGYAFVNDNIDKNIGDYVSAVFDETIRNWKEWSGAYSGVLFYYLPKITFDDSTLLIGINIFRISLFFVSVILYTVYVMKRITKNKLFCLALSGGLLWTFTNFKSFAQVYFWQPGMILYLFCFSCLLLALYFLYRTSDKNRSIDCILACVFAVIAMGGAQNIAFSGCFLALGEVITVFYEKHLKIKVLIVFSFFVCFASLNCFAPGNFARHTQIDQEGKLHILRSLAWSLKDDVIYSEEYFKDTAFFAVVILFVLLGYWIKTNADKGLLIKLCFMLFMPIAALFPACLGYSSSYMQNRIRFVVEFWVLMRWLLVAIAIGMMLRVLIEKSGDIVTFVLLLSSVLALAVCSWRIENGQLYKLQNSIISGELKRYKDGVEKILSEIERSSESDVITSDVPVPVEGFMVLYYTDDPTFFGNQEMASFFGKDSVRAIGNREYHADELP